MLKKITCEKKVFRKIIAMKMKKRLPMTYSTKEKVFFFSYDWRVKSKIAIEACTVSFVECEQKSRCGIGMVVVVDRMWWWFGVVECVTGKKE